jgi:hypothetical protein
MRYRNLTGLFGVFAAASTTACEPSEALQAKEVKDAEFAALQARGAQAMGVDQYTSTHVFDARPDGGRIELQRDVDDPEGVDVIRTHLSTIALAFASGDFTTPAFVHLRDVPGTAVMAALRDKIRYVYADLPRGGELRLVGSDPEAIRAIHEFMSFQQQDHHAAGAEHPHGTEGLHPVHGPEHSPDGANNPAHGSGAPHPMHGPRHVRPGGGR